MQEVNCVELKGTIRSELKYDHQDYYGTKFYYTKLVAKKILAGLKILYQF